MTRQTRSNLDSSRDTTATPDWLWAPVLATTTMLAIPLFAPMPTIL
jgi:hypothetical protein